MTKEVIITKERKTAIPIKAVKVKDAMKKPEIIREIAQITGQTQGVVRDILNTFVDLAQREQLTTGVFHYPGLVTIKRGVRAGYLRYQKDIDKTLLYPETCMLTAKVSEPVKKLHREMFRNQLNEENGTDPSNWWEAYVFCDGNYKEKGLSLKDS